LYKINILLREFKRVLIIISGFGIVV